MLYKLFLYLKIRGLAKELNHQLEQHQQDLTSLRASLTAYQQRKQHDTQ